jgi:hypothetical protein
MEGSEAAVLVLFPAAAEGVILAAVAAVKLTFRLAAAAARITTGQTK